jgi:hypothetical protein
VINEIILYTKITHNAVSIFLFKKIRKNIMGNSSEIKLKNEIISENPIKGPQI